MTLSLATLSTIVAVLSAQGVVVTHSQVDAALATLAGRVVDTSVDLQPGEFFVMNNHEDGEIEEYKSREALDEQLQRIVDRHEIGASYRCIKDYVTIWVARREVNADSQKTVTITLS